jgi:hypothetical protein
VPPLTSEHGAEPLRADDEVCRRSAAFGDVDEALELPARVLRVPTREPVADAVETTA